VLTRSDVVLVDGALRDARHERLPDPGLAQRRERMARRIPAVEVADDRDRLRVGGKDGERDAILPVERAQMSAQLFPEAKVRTLVEEEKILLRQERRARAGLAGARHGSGLPFVDHAASRSAASLHSATFPALCARRARLECPPMDGTA